MKIHQFGRFIGVGGINTLVGLMVIYGCKWWLAFGDAAANASGYGIGITLSYVLNRRWTFGYRGDHVSAFPRFLLVNFVAYLANLSLVMAAIRLGNMNSYLSQALGIPVFTLASYLGSRWFAFRQEDCPGEPNTTHH